MHKCATVQWLENHTTTVGRNMCCKCVIGKFKPLYKPIYPINFEATHTSCVFLWLIKKALQQRKFQCF